MVLKKHSKISGQAIMEYFLIFGMVIALTLVASSSFIPMIRESLQGSGGYVDMASRRLGVGAPVSPPGDPIATAVAP
jgi:hypothetical protein